MNPQERSRSISISCDTCIMRSTAHCAECIVTYIISPPHREPESLTADDVRAINLLANAGMVPTLLHREAE